MIVIALILADAGLAAFAVVIGGIQATEHRMGLHETSCGRADAFARRVLRAYAAEPAISSLRMSAAARHGRGSD